ncbi:MAG: cytochrome o ubiquinol oxidase subunit IV [Gammaproteobacteria bacterium]
MKPYIAESPPSLTAYLAGFTLALLLTLLAFGLVSYMAGTPPLWLIVAGVSSLAVLQILVHLRCFLHLKFDSLNYLNVRAILFALFIIAIMVGGTLWILHAMNYQMVPGIP